MKIYLGIILICLLISAGCIQSNEFIPVTPSEKISDAHGVDCRIVIGGKSYRGTEVACKKITLNQTNWVKFCPEITDFPLCEVRL